MERQLPLDTDGKQHLDTTHEGLALAGLIEDSSSWHDTTSVQQPSHVQAHGVFMLLEASEVDDHLPILIVSENCRDFFGKLPDELFALQSVLGLFDEDQADDFADCINLLRDDPVEAATNAPEVFSLEIASVSSKKPMKLWCALRLVAGDMNLIICEFEPADGSFYPLFSGHVWENDETSSQRSLEDHTLDMSAEKIQGDTQSSAARGSGIRTPGRADTTSILDLLSRFEEQLGSTTDLPSLLSALVSIVAELTGFQHVMVLRANGSGGGRMITEFVDSTVQEYVGGPNSDTMQYEVLRENRMLYDSDQPDNRLLFREGDSSISTLDFRHAYLSVMPPLRMEHMDCPRARSSMSLSIDLPTEVWGSIVCHSYFSNVTRTSFPKRKMCRFVSTVAARNIQRLLDEWHIQAWNKLNTIFTPSPVDDDAGPVPSSDDLLRLFHADFGIHTTGTETKIFGQIDRAQEALAVLEYFKVCKTHSVLASNDVKRELATLKYSPGFKSIAEMLVIPTSHETSAMFLLFRGPRKRALPALGDQGSEGEIEEEHCEVIETTLIVPQQTPTQDTAGWTEEQLNIAAVLGSVPADILQAWFDRDAAPLSRLKKLLLGNSAHDIRTPLNAVVNYLEVALEGPLDAKTRKHLLDTHAKTKELMRAVASLEGAVGT